MKAPIVSRIPGEGLTYPMNGSNNNSAARKAAVWLRNDCADTPAVEPRPNDRADLPAIPTDLRCSAYS